MEPLLPPADPTVAATEYLGKLHVEVAKNLRGTHERIERLIAYQKGAVSQEMFEGYERQIRDEWGRYQERVAPINREIEAITKRLVEATSLESLRWVIPTPPQDELQEPFEGKS